MRFPFCLSRGTSIHDEHCLSHLLQWSFSKAEMSRFVEEKLLMHKRSARSLHLNGSIKSGGTSLFGGGGSMVIPTSNYAGTIFKVRTRTEYTTGRVMCARNSPLHWDSKPYCVPQLIRLILQKRSHTMIDLFVTVGIAVLVPVTATALSNSRVSLF